MSNFLTPTKMIAAYGAYYREGTITVQQLHDQIFETSDTKRLFLTRPTTNTRIDNVNTSLTSVLQPFYSKFSSLGVMDFDPNPWNLDRVKINVGLKPDDLAATALDFFVQKGVSRKDAPIITTISEYLIKKAKEDDELHATFKGVFTLPSAEDQALGVPGNPLGARNGIRKKIRDYNTAGKFAVESTVLSMGAPPTDPAQFVTYMETMYYSIPEKFRVFIKFFAMSQTLKQRYIQGMRAKYDVNYPQTGGVRTFIIDTDCEIMGFASHNGSDMIWTTIEGNAIGFIKNPENQSVFDLGVRDIYEVLMATDWYEGYDFINPYWIWTNGRDLV